MFPKEFIIEDGHIYYRKKPLYKQPLFWTSLAGFTVAFILGLLLFLTVLGLAGSSYASSYMQESYDDLVSDPFMEKEIGQEVELSSGLRLTVQSMELDSKIELDDSDYHQAMVITVEVKNPTEERLYFDEQDSLLFGTQDSDEIESVYILDNRTYDGAFKKKINPGETVEYTLIYGVDGASSYHLMYEGNVWDFQREEKL